MCSNMCARPVLPMGSCTEPASTCVKNENTGASGRSQMMMVRPLASFFTVVRFSKEAKSWPRAIEHSTKQTTSVCIEVKRTFILPPRPTTKIRNYVEAGSIVKRALRPTTEHRGIPPSCVKVDRCRGDSGIIVMAGRRISERLARRRRAPEFHEGGARDERAQEARACRPDPGSHRSALRREYVGCVS